MNILREQRDEINIRNDSKSKGTMISFESTKLHNHILYT